MECAPDLGEALVVRVAAQRAGPMACGERGHLVEEEELRELAGLEERAALPTAELEAAGDPAPAVEAPADASAGVVEAPAVPVDEPARRIGDELAEGCDAILQPLRTPPCAIVQRQQRWIERSSSATSSSPTAPPRKGEDAAGRWGRVPQEEVFVVLRAGSPADLRAACVPARRFRRALGNATSTHQR